MVPVYFFCKQCLHSRQHQFLFLCSSVDGDPTINISIFTLANTFYQVIVKYDWPGTISVLRNFVFHVDLTF